MYFLIDATIFPTDENSKEYFALKEKGEKGTATKKECERLEQLLNGYMNDYKEYNELPKKEQEKLYEKSLKLLRKKGYKCKR